MHTPEDETKTKKYTISLVPDIDVEKFSFLCRVKGILMQIRKSCNVLVFI